MDSIREITDELFKDIKMSENQKRAFLGMYLIGYFKTVLELLIALKGNDQDFIQKLTVFFDESIKTLPEPQRKKFEEEVDIQKGKLLGEMVKITDRNIEEDLKPVFKKNLQSLLQKLTKA